MCSYSVFHIFICIYRRGSWLMLSLVVRRKFCVRFIDAIFGAVKEIFFSIKFFYLMVSIKYRWNQVLLRSIIIVCEKKLSVESNVEKKLSFESNVAGIHIIFLHMFQLLFSSTKMTARPFLRSSDTPAEKQNTAILWIYNQVWVLGYLAITGLVDQLMQELLAHRIN